MYSGLYFPIRGFLSHGRIAQNFGNNWIIAKLVLRDGVTVLRQAT